MDQLPRTDPIPLHEEWLVARVREALQEQPELRMVALIVEANAPEALSFLQSEAEIHRAEGGTFSLLLTRDSAKNFLAQASPWILEWLESDASGVIPVIHSARGGMRTGKIEYDAAS